MLILSAVRGLMCQVIGDNFQQFGSSVQNYRLIQGNVCSTGAFGTEILSTKILSCSVCKCKLIEFCIVIEKCDI